MIIKLKIEKAVYEGYGLGFHEGRAIFVPYSVPGDECEVEITKERKSHCFGRIVQIIAPSASRIEPECPNFGVCGGCDYLNIAYDKELSYKKQILEDSLARIGRVAKERMPEISVITGGRFHYRSHADIKCGNGLAGFFEKNTHQLTPFPPGGCLLLSPPIIGRLSRLETARLKQFRIAASHDNECLLSTDRPAVVRESENGIEYDRDISCFFQANAFLRPKMLQTVKEFAALSASDSFLDIGCGVGFFTLYLSQFAGFCEGIDIDSAAIKWARRNAETNGCGNVKFIKLTATDIKAARGGFDAVIADPPRPGLSYRARDKIKCIRPRRIVYVSCNPATFARDVADFSDSGYSIRKLALIDMFPGTYHIEIIGLLHS